MPFQLQAPYEPRGDQPEAIAALADGVARGARHQTLLGVTGSGKTFTLANVIARADRPALVISPNKTLAAQLYGELRQFFPENGVGFFISYYDYYQPEAYVPASNTYIEKDASINEDIDRLRLAATGMLLERRDVVIVASVSCIYGIGSPEDFRELMLALKVGQHFVRSELLRRLVDLQYSRNDLDFRRGTFRVRGDVIEVRPAYEEEAVRVELAGNEVERLSRVDPVSGKTLRRLDRVSVWPAKQFVTAQPRLLAAVGRIRAELEERVAWFESQGRALEAQRLRLRTEYDLEMLQEIGYCPGIENYSRHLSGRAPGERPACLLDYFPRDFLCILDESHVSVPQVGAMYEGDRSRKQTLVDFGFRLPSALDNRPLRFDEFEALVPQTIYASATPSEFELQRSGGVVVEQVIRPTGLVDPPLVVRPVQGQIDDLLREVRLRVERQERVLVTTLTKRMAEDLADYLAGVGVRVRYLHSDIDALERVDLLRGLRLAEFDVLVGINLLREGLDLPEVSLVAILDADKEGYLRSERSLIQTAGRAARNVGGMVLLYADSVTGSMDRAMQETERRRRKQLAYNQEHGVVPRTIVKSVEDVMRSTEVADAAARRGVALSEDLEAAGDPVRMRQALELEMLEAARQLEFEKAAALRDRLEELETAAAADGRAPAYGAGAAGGAHSRAAARQPQPAKRRPRGLLPAGARRRIEARVGARRGRPGK
ncbi:MAG TPA: excinuclease ABC subunit UvrB [Candidatus Saccharimonadales bacterium]|nr:excinuclease ABC subunit UvrB [Candidatus Saccharimonadales bacterium]